MNQKVAWSMLIGGATFFLGQAAELIASHSTWAELVTPASTADFLRLFAALVPTIAGALGVTLATTPQKETPPVTTSSSVPPAAIILLALLVYGSACTGAHSAPIQVNPTTAAVAQTQKDIIRAVEATTTALKIANIAVTAADELNKAKLLPNDVTKTIATAGLAFANGADLALKELQAVGASPNVATTSKRLVGLLDPFLKTLEDSKNEKLQAFATSLRIGMTVVRTIGG